MPGEKPQPDATDESAEFQQERSGSAVFDDLVGKETESRFSDSLVIAEIPQDADVKLVIKSKGKNGAEGNTRILSRSAGDKDTFIPVLDESGALAKFEGLVLTGYEDSEGNRVRNIEVGQTLGFSAVDQNGDVTVSNFSEVESFGLVADQADGPTIQVESYPENVAA